MNEEELRKLAQEAHQRGDKPHALALANKILELRKASSAPGEPALGTAGDLGKSAEISALMPVSSTLDTLERGSRQFDRTAKGALWSDEGGVLDPVNVKDTMGTALWGANQVLNVGTALAGKAYTAIRGEKPPESKFLSDKMEQLKAERSAPVKAQYDSVMDAANNSDSIIDFVKKAPSPLDAGAGYFHAFVEQIGNTAASMVATKGASMIKAARVRSKMAKLGATSEEVRRQVLKDATAVGVAVGTATEYQMVASQVGQQIDQQMMAMPQSSWDKNEDYKRLREHTTDQEAKQIVTDRLARQYGRIAGVGSALINMPFSTMLAKAGAGKGGLKHWALGTATETVSEGSQEFWEGFNQNLAAQKVDPDTELLKGLGGQAAFGALMGGAMGAVASVSPRSKDEKDLAKAGIDDYEKAVKVRAKLEQTMREPKTYNKMSPAQKIETFRKLEDAQLKENEHFLDVAKGMRKILTRNDAQPEEFDQIDVLEKIARDHIDRITSKREILKTAAEESSRQQAVADQVTELRSARDQGLASIDDEKRWLGSLQHLAGGNVLEEEAAKELLGKKWIRYPDLTKSHAVLTPSGRRAISGLTLSIQNHEGQGARTEAALETVSETKQPVPEVPTERRVNENVDRRAKLEEMKKLDPEAFHREIFVDKKSGILNKRAYVEAEKTPSPHTVSIDADSLAWVNDNMSHLKGDEMLERIGRVLGEEFGEDAYHVSGDEFIVRGDDAAKLEEGMQRAKLRLRRMRVQDAQRVVTPSITWGIGANREAADVVMNEAKVRRLKEGKRADRKLPPVGMRPKPNAAAAAGATTEQTTDVPPVPPDVLASEDNLDDDEAWKEEVTETALTASTFAERMRSMAMKMRNLYKASVGEQRALEDSPTAPQFNTRRLTDLAAEWRILQAQAVDEFEAWRYEVTPDTELNEALVAKARFRYHNLPANIRAVYDGKARDFYSLILAEPFLTGQDAWVIEYTGLLAYRVWDETLLARQLKLPAPMTTIGGGKFTHGIISTSDMAERIRQLVQDSGDAYAENDANNQFLSEFLLSDLRKEATNRNRQLQIKPDEAKWSSIHLQPEGAVRPVTAADVLIYRVERYITKGYESGGQHPFVINQKEMTAYRESDDKLASWYARMHAATDSVMAPGFYDRVAKGRYIEVAVGGKSVRGRVISSTEKALTVEWVGPQAWDPDEGQVSNTARFAKSTGLQISQRVSKDGIPIDEQMFRWPGQARLGRVHVNGHWRTARELSREIDALDKEIENRMPRTLQSWRAGQRKNSATSEEHAAAEAIIRNMTAGINLPADYIYAHSNGTTIPRAMQGWQANRPNARRYGWWDQNDVSDGIHLVLSDIKKGVEAGVFPSFEHGVAETIAHELFGHFGIRGLIGNDPDLINIMKAVVEAFPQEAAYFASEFGYTPQVAGEEIIAALAQRILIDNMKLSTKQLSIWKKFLFWLREAMAKRGWHKWMKGPLAFNDEQLGYMVARAQEALQRSANWKYKHGEGRVSTPLSMRDSDMFQSALLHDMSRFRPTSKAERKAGMPVGVPVIPDEATAGGFLNAFRALIKDKDSAVKQLDLDTAALEEWLENLRNADVLAYAPEQLEQIIGEVPNDVKEFAAGLINPALSVSQGMAVVMGLQEWASKPLHKKARIPSSMIETYLIDAVPAVMVHPAAGYRNGDYNPLVGRDDEGNWLPDPAMDPGNPQGEGVGWWSTALSGKNVRNYLLAQVNPKTRAPYVEPHWTKAPKSKGENVYLHIRVSDTQDAEAVFGTATPAPNPAKTGRAYHVGEVQSTWNQNQGRFIQGEMDKRNTQAMAHMVSRELAAGGLNGLFGEIGRQLAAGVEFGHEKAKKMRAENDGTSTFYRALQKAQLKNYASHIEKTKLEAQRSLRILSEKTISPNDIRWDEFKRLSVMIASYDNLIEILEDKFDPVGRHNPNGALDFPETQESLRSIFGNITQMFLNGNTEHTHAAFLAGDDILFERFANSLLGFFAAGGGLQTGDKKGYDALGDVIEKLKSERALGDSLRIVIPDGVLPWTREIRAQGQVGPAANPFEYVWTSLGLKYSMKDILRGKSLDIGVPLIDADICGDLLDSSIAVSQASNGDMVIDIPWGSNFEANLLERRVAGKIFEAGFREAFADLARLTEHGREEDDRMRTSSIVNVLRNASMRNEEQWADTIAGKMMNTTGHMTAPRHIPRVSTLMSGFPVRALNALAKEDADVRNQLDNLHLGGIPSLEEFSEDWVGSVLFNYVLNPPEDDPKIWSRISDENGPLDERNTEYLLTLAEVSDTKIPLDEAKGALESARRKWLMDQHFHVSDQDNEHALFAYARQETASRWFNLEGGTVLRTVPRKWDKQTGVVTASYQVYVTAVDTDEEGVFGPTNVKGWFIYDDLYNRIEQDAVFDTDDDMTQVRSEAARWLTTLWMYHEVLPELSVMQSLYGDNLAHHSAHEAIAWLPEKLDWEAVAKNLTEKTQYISVHDPADFKKVYKQVRDAATKSAMGVDQYAVDESVFSHDDVWRTHALKFILMDAIRHGYAKIQWQPGEANTSRGGVSPNLIDNVDSIKFRRAQMDGKEVYVVKYHAEQIYIPTESLDAVFGIDVADFMKKAVPPEGPAIDAPILSVSKAGDRWVVIDKSDRIYQPYNTGAVVATFDTAEEAWGYAGERAAQPGEVQANKPVYMSATRADFNGPINVVLARRSNDKFDPMSSFIPHNARVIQGGRIAYDRALVKTWNKYLKNFGVQISSGAAAVTEEAAQKAIKGEGGRRVNFITPTYENAYPNPRVAKLDGEDLYVLLSDNKQIDNTVYQNEEAAYIALEARIAAWGGSIDREAVNKAIKVHEIVINDALREYFKEGSIPLFHQSPTQPPNRLTAEERLMTKVGVKRRKRPLKQVVAEAMENIRNIAHQRIFDRFHGIRQAFVDAQLWDTVADEKNPYFAARLGTSLDSHVKSALEYGVPVWKNGVFSADGKGLLEVLSPIAHETSRWGAFMAARRAQRLLGEGKENLLEADEIAAGLALGVKYPIFQQVADEYAAWNKRLLDFAQESGIINAETRALWEHADYVPFYRISDDRLMGALGRNIGLANQKNPIKSLTGGTDYLGDIVTNIMVNMVNLIDASVKNRAALLAVDGLAGSGKIQLSASQGAQTLHPKLMAQMVGPNMIDGADIGPKLKAIQNQFLVTDSALTAAIPGMTANRMTATMTGNRAKISLTEVNQILEAIETVSGAGNVVPRATVLTDNVISRVGLAREQKLVPAAEIKRSLQQAGVSAKLINSIPQAAFEGLRMMWTLSPPKAKGTLSVMRDGKVEFYHTPDQLLFDAMTSLNMPRFGWFVAALRYPKRLLTSTITLDPGFMIANFLRDSVSSWVIARDWQTPFVHAAKGAVDAYREDKDFRTMMSAGAAFENGYLNYGDPDAVHRLMRRSMRKKGYRASLLDSPKKLYEAYRAIGSATENASRMAVMRAAKRNGASDVRAAYEAKDLMDFSMGGSSKVIQFLIQTVPFFNARQQGIYRLGRGAGLRGEGGAGAFALRGMLVALAGLALFWKYKDDDRYKDLEEWDKDTNFHFWIGDEHYRLPKGFEVGAIFNTIPERAVEYFFNESGDDEKLLWDRFAFMVTQTFAFNPIPQAFVPLVETAANYNFFTGRSIANEYEISAKLPQDQYRFYTSPTMIELARHIPGEVQFRAQKLSSPLFLQNLYGGYFGTLGRYVLMGSDAIVRSGFGYPDIPTLGPQDYPVLGRFSRGPDVPRRTKYEEQFYDLLSKVKQVDGSFKYYEAKGPKTRVQETFEKFGDYVRISEGVNDIQKEVTQINSEMRDVYNSTSKSSDEKYTKLNQMQAKKNLLLKKGAALRPNAAESPDVRSSVQKKLSSADPPEKISENIKGVAPTMAALILDVAGMSMRDAESLMS